MGPNKRKTLGLATQLPSVEKEKLDYKAMKHVSDTMGIEWDIVEKVFRFQWKTVLDSFSEHTSIDILDIMKIRMDQKRVHITMGREVDKLERAEEAANSFEIKGLNKLATVERKKVKIAKKNIEELSKKIRYDI